VQISTMLIDAGADVDAKDQLHGKTPLHWASCHADTWRSGYRNQDEVVSLLLHSHADVSARDRDGATPLHVAASAERPSAVRMLLDAGADVDASHALHGWTPLHSAFGATDFQDGARPLSPRPEGLGTARVLLDAGADVAVKDRKGRTPSALGRRAGWKAGRTIPTRNPDPLFLQVPCNAGLQEVLPPSTSNHVPLTHHSSLPPPTAPPPPTPLPPPVP
jgi:hypothetical protein